MCPVLVRTRTWQSQFGAKRGNFRAYRKFCKRRNKKIRKGMKISYGRKFSKEKSKTQLTPEFIENLSQEQGRTLVESFLLMAEKHAIVYQESKSTSGNIARREVKRQLQTALKYVGIIDNNLKQFLSTRGKGELDIYCWMLEAALFLEKKCFKEAKEKTVKIIAVLGQMMGVMTTVEKAQLEELLETARQNLRYCKFQLKEFDRAEEKDMTVIRDSKDVQEFLEKVSKTTLAGMHSVSVFGKQVEIDDEQAIAVLNKEKLLRQNMSITSADTTSEELFWELANVYEEGIRICHKKRTEAGNNASLGNIWSSIEHLCSFQKHLILFKRNLKLFRAYDKKFETSDAGSDRRPQESIKQLENLLVHVRSLADVLIKFDQNSNIFPTLEKILRAEKCMFICLFYNKNKCFKEGLSLAEAQMNVLSEIKGISDCAWIEDNFGIGSAYALTPLVQEMAGMIQKIQNGLKDLAKQAKVGLFDQSQESMHQLNENFEELNLPAPEISSNNINSLMDLVVSGNESRSKGQMDFMRLPPVGSIMPSKPINLDLVWTLLEYGSVPETLIEQPKKGFFGNLFKRG